MYEKFHGGLQTDEKPQVTQNFLKKYIFYAKKQHQPVLTDDATNYISEFWSDLRQRVLNNDANVSGKKVLPITIRYLSFNANERSLETLIRLSTAHAKLRLSNQVKVQDAKFAERLLNYALF